MEMRDLSCSLATAEACMEEMERDDTIFIIGEDLVAHGGIFGQFRGVPQKFPERIIDSPISETSIVGAGVGPQPSDRRFDVVNLRRELCLWARPNGYAGNRKTCREQFGRDAACCLLRIVGEPG